MKTVKFDNWDKRGNDIIVTLESEQKIDMVPKKKTQPRNKALEKLEQKKNYELKKDNKMNKEFTPEPRYVIDYLHGYCKYGNKMIDKMNESELKDNYGKLLNEINRIHNHIRGAK